MISCVPVCFLPSIRALLFKMLTFLLVQPRFADWRVLNTQALVVGKIEPQADGRLKVEFRLWDVFAEQQMTGLAYFTVPPPPIGAAWRISSPTQSISASRVKTVTSIRASSISLKPGPVITA